MQVQRYDRAELKAVITDEGFLQDSPVVGRIGIQEYRRDDGSIRRELRLPEEVFHPDALASLKGKPITVDHPSTGKVDKKNAHRFTVGSMLAEGKQDGDFVRADIVIHSPDSIGDRRELSLGYTAHLDEQAGEHPVFGKYDAIQRNIRVNHLSVVKSARAGKVARLNLDGDEVLDFSPPPQEHQTMTVKVKLDNGIEYEAAPEVAAELSKLRADASAAVEKLSAIPKLEAERDALKSRVDGFADELESARKQGRADAENRAQIEKVAATLKVDCAGKSDREVKEAVILAVRKDAKLDGKDDAYIDAAFDMAAEMKADVAMAAQRVAANTVNDSAKGESATSKREAMIANLKGGK